MDGRVLRTTSKYAGTKLIAFKASFHQSLGGRDIRELEGPGFRWWELCVLYAL